MSDFTFYYGATNGQTKGALTRLEEPNVMINYASYTGEVWDGIDRLFIDSGGYSFIKGMGEYETSHAEYLDWIERVEPELFALRDYPCEPDVLEKHDRTVRDHQQMTTRDHRELMDEIEERNIDADPVAVVQGRSVDEYLRHVDDLRDRGLLTDVLGVGSVCGRHALKEIKPIVKAIDDATPSRVSLHGFGLKIQSLEVPEIYDRLNSADSMAYSYSARTDSRQRDIMCGFRQHALHYLELRRKMLELQARHADKSQRTIGAYNDA